MSSARSRPDGAEHSREPHVAGVSDVRRRYAHLADRRRDGIRARASTADRRAGRNGVVGILSSLDIIGRYAQREGYFPGTMRRA